MPRLARLDAPGVLHHVIIRGIELRGIFRDDFDRDNFLERLSILVPETQTICYAWGYLCPIMRIIEKVENRVMETSGLERDVLYFKGRRKIQVVARSLLCY